MKKFIQIFRNAASSGYGKQALIEEFKKEMDRRIRKRLMEVECPLKSKERVRSKMEEKERKKKKK